MPFIFVLLTTTAFAQSKQKPYIANIRVEVDTVKKNVRFKYDLLRAEPEDSIYVQLETADNTFSRKRYRVILAPI